MRTRGRVLAGSLALAAVFLYLAVTVPARQAAGEAGDALARARVEEQALRSRLSDWEVRTAAEERATAAVAAAGDPGDAVGRLRRSVVASLEGAGVSGVRLGVSAGRPPEGARVQLSAEGPYAVALPLTAYLARPGSGLILEAVRLRPTPAGLTFELTGFSLAGRP